MSISFTTKSAILGTLDKITAHLTNESKCQIYVCVCVCVCVLTLSHNVLFVCIYI